MPTSRLILTAAVALAAALFQAGVASAASCPGADTVLTTEAERRQALETIRCLVNAERAKRGGVRLSRSSTLARVARNQSVDMERFNYVAHVNRAGQNVRTRVARSGYRARYAGEAVGWGSGARSSPRALMREVMADLAHRRVVRSVRYRDIGVGLVFGTPVAGKGGGATLTLVLGRRR